MLETHTKKCLNYKIWLDKNPTYEKPNEQRMQAKTPNIVSEITKAVLRPKKLHRKTSIGCLKIIRHIYRLDSAKESDSEREHDHHDVASVTAQTEVLTLFNRMTSGNNATFSLDA